MADLSRENRFPLILLALTLAVPATLREARAEADGRALAMSSLRSSQEAASENSDITGGDSEKSAGSNPVSKTRAKDARLHFEKGLQYQRTGDSGRALIEFLKATREDPKQLDAYYEQALIFREKGFHKLAVSRLEQALAIKPKYQKARLLLATIKLEQGKVTDAVEELGTSLGLPKTETTAINPDTEPAAEGNHESLPAMVLQSLHAALPLPAVKGSTISDAQAAQDKALEAELREATDPSPRQVVRKSVSNRKKIRQLIARRYGKRSEKNKRQEKHWITRLFAWTSSDDGVQRTSHPVPENMDDDGDLKAQFRNDEIRQPFEDRTAVDTMELEISAREFPRPAPIPQARVAETWTQSSVSTAKVETAKPPAEETREKPEKAKRSVNTLAYIGDVETTTKPDKAAKKAAQEKPAKRATPAVIEDEWTVRLRYLNEHGTSSLKQGEAFMFSEDTGEAVIFLKDGQRIRRVIAEPVDSQEVLKSRRPDVLIPKELYYNTSLLGKVVNTTPKQQAPAPVMLPPVVPTIPQLPPQSNPPQFRIEQMSDNPSGFWNWAKGLINL